MEDVNISESVPIPRRRSIQITEEEPVGFEDATERILPLLTGGTKDLDIISIVGMAGLGKTTLATRIFRSSSVVSHFDVQAWITISQTYNVRGMLRDIYMQVKGVERTEGQMDESNIADMLRKLLMCRRYLIVLDDIWEVKAWDELQLCFPIGGNGNRILLTSRLKQVAEEVMRHNDPYCLGFLTTDESWKLLQKKVFQQKETCPPELVDIGLQVAQYCKGLPLTVVLIGGIIAKKKRNVTERSDVASSLKSYVSVVETGTIEAMELSYQYLPEHLKPCLLYMAIFSEDANIGVSKLMQLWVAEGFVPYSDDERRSEEVGGGYLMDLISSSLVMVSKITYKGKVKYCKIHDLVREFCLNKLKQEKFMKVIGPHNQYQPLYYDEQQLCFHLDSSFYRILEERGGLDNFLACNSGKETPFRDNLISLFVTNVEAPYHYRATSLLFNYLRFLRVMDLMNFYVEDYQYPLQSLVHLRYLGICCLDFLFDWVLHLSHLETLEVISEGGVLVPPTILTMRKLKHVNIHRGALFAVMKESSEEPASKLENLHTFNSIKLYVDEDTEELMKMFSNLQELGLRPFRFYSTCPLSLKLEVLTQLQSLTISMDIVPSSTIVDFYFPLSLKELILKHAHLSRSATAAIARLLNLERLEFKHSTFEQNKWDVRDTEFPALKFLKFQRCAGFSKWHASESSFPMLENLVLKSCWTLKKIPSSFVDVQTLKSIKVTYRGNSDLRDSALMIKQEVEAIAGCDQLQVQLDHSFWLRCPFPLPKSILSSPQIKIHIAFNHRPPIRQFSGHRFPTMMLITPPPLERF